jgi:hypothetical protein
MHPQFLSPHPPVHDPELIRDLFHGRAEEVAQVARDLHPQNDYRQILAIYGETRVGKSHLALRAAQDLPRGKDGYSYLYVNANQRITTNTVLWEALKQLSEAILSLEGGSPLRDLAPQWIAEIGRFRSANVTEVTLRSNTAQLEEVTRSVTAKGEGSIGSTVLGFIKAKVGFGIERMRSTGESRSRQDEVQIRMSPPSADHLAEILGFLGSVLVQEQCCRRVLLLVDDVDLLVPQVSGPAKTEADILVDALRALAALEAFTVVTTVREEFWERKGKDFRSLRFVDRLPSETPVVTIYGTHVQTLNSGISPYTAEAVYYLARNAGGGGGRFFDECDRMRQHFTGADGEWSLDRVVEYYRREVTRRAGTELRSVVGAIETAAKAGRPSLGPEAFRDLGLSLDLIKASPLMGRVLHPSRYGSDLFEIDPFFLDAWRLPPREGEG